MNTGFDINAEDSLGNTLLLVAVQQVQVQTLPIIAKAVLCAALASHIPYDLRLTGTKPDSTCCIRISFAMPGFHVHLYSLPRTFVQFSQT